MPVNYIPHPIRALAADVLGARALGVNYQNATLRPLLVFITCWHVVGNAANACRSVVYLENATPPWLPAAYGGYLNPPGIGTLHSFQAIMVPPGWYYRIQDLSGVGNVSQLNEWWEINL